MKNEVKTNYLALYGNKLINNGYQIVPITPGFKYPKNHGRWQKVNFNKILPSLLANGSALDYVAVKLGYGIAALDLDLFDSKIADLTIKWVTKNIGATPVRYGQKPKAMMFFSTSEMMKKRTSPKYLDLFGISHQVEVLGHGQQALVYAIHPDTKEPYSWSDDSGIADIRKEDLPVLSSENIDDLFDYIESIKPADWVTHQQKSDSILQSDPLLNIKPKLDISIEKIKQSLSNIDPDSDYFTWAKIGMALHHQFDGNIKGFELWDNWSQLGGKYNTNEMAFKWSSFKANIKNTNPVTFASVLHLTKNDDVVVTDNTDTGFKLIHASEVMSKLGSVNWAIKDYFEANTFGVLYGEPGSYKSFLAIDIALHIATGLDWHGHKVMQGLAILIEGEGIQGIAKRLCSWGKHKQVDLANHPVYVSQSATALLDARAATQTYNTIKAIVEETGQKPAIVVIDTLARNFGPGDENSTADMSMFIKTVDIIRQKFGCLVLVVHHTGRNDKNRARGSIALDGGADFIYQVDKPEMMKAKLTCKKMKDAIEPEPAYFEAESVLIDIQDDEEITSLVFDKTDAPIKVLKSLKGNQELLYKLIKKHTFEGSVDRKHITEMAILESLYKSEKVVKTTLNRLADSGYIRLKDNEIIDLGGWS